MSISIQQQIKNNSTDIKSYIDDLYKWEDTVKQNPQKPLKKPINPDLPPIRGKVQSESLEKDHFLSNSDPKNPNIKLKRDGNTVSDYYKAWDKFDPDEELKKLDEDKGNNDSKPPISSKPINLNNNKEVLAPAYSKITVKGGRNPNSEYEALKDKANLYYRNYEYQKALEIYNEIIEKIQKGSGNPSMFLSLLLSNRAMTFIKLQDYVKAEIDCKIAIENTPDFYKPYARRGLCRKKMGKIKLAIKDFQKSLDLEGNYNNDNKEVIAEIKALEEILRKRRIKAAKSLILPGKNQGKWMKIEVEDIGVHEKIVEEINEEENEKKDLLKNMSFTVEGKKEEINKKEEIKKKNPDFLNNNKENQQIPEENIEKKPGNPLKAELSYDYAKLKEIDRVSKGKTAKIEGDFEEIERKKVSFGGESDIMITNLKKNVFSAKNMPKVSILKLKNTVLAKIPENQEKIGLENVILKGKIEIIEKILKETKEIVEKTEVISSARFFSNWKNVNKDQKAAFSFLKVFF